MKKSAAALVLTALLLSFAACSDKPAVTTAAETDTYSSVSETDGATKEMTSAPETAELETDEESADDTVTETETETETETDAKTTTAAVTTKPKSHTAVPSIKGNTLLEPGVALIYGSCEEDSVIKLVCGGFESEIKADGGFFAASVPLEGKSAEARLTAKAPGKEESPEAVCKLKNSGGAENRGLTVTLGSRVIEKRVLADAYGTNAFSSGEIEKIKKNARYRVQRAETKAGKPVNIVYIIVPDPLTVYPEELTEEMKNNVEEPSKRMKQAVAALSGVEGVTVVDLTKALTEKKDCGKLYYKLDSHWTELGAFYGYQAVMEALGLPHRELSDYNIDIETIDDTDMTVYSGVGTGEMFEAAPFLSALFEEKTPYGRNKENTARIWSFVNPFFSGKVSVTETGDTGMPSAIFLFDSYGLNMIPYFAETFNVFVTEPCWEYNIDYSLVQKYAPDHVIMLLAERTLNELVSAV